MKTIQLTQNMRAVLDDDDYDCLSRYKWFYRGERDGNLGYAVRHGKKTDTKKTIYLHREVLHEKVPPGHEVIFLNHDGLDCRKENLRAVTKQEARQHHRVRKDSKHGAKGIRYNRDTNTWSAYIYRSGNAQHVGTFYLRHEAEQAYQMR